MLIILGKGFLTFVVMTTNCCLRFCAGKCLLKRVGPYSAEFGHHPNAPRWVNVPNRGSFLPLDFLVLPVIPLTTLPRTSEGHSRCLLDAIPTGSLLPYGRVCHVIPGLNVNKSYNGK